MRFLSILTTAAAAVAQTIAVRNATIIDVTTGDARRGNIVVVGPKITAVGPAARIPASAKVIDGAGKFVIPGLWDMHVHLWEDQPMFDLYAAHGVTAIRDMGSIYDRTRRWAKQGLAGTGPRVFTCGAPVDTPASEAMKFPVTRAGRAEDGRRAADLLGNQGVDFVKVLSTLPRDAYIALAQRARVRRMFFAGHVPESVSVSEAVEARQRSMEHLFGIAIACSNEEEDLRSRRPEAIARKDTDALREIREQARKTFSEAKAEDLFKRMARFGVWQVPTLTLRQRLALIELEQLATGPHVKAVPKAIRSAWPNPRDSLKDVSSEALDRLRADYDFHCRLVGLMRINGVELLAGTDTGDPYVVPGAALHDELKLLVDAGITPLEALRAATWNAARYFSLDASSGSIARGKIADLVVLDANPLVDIRNTRRIRAVLVRGKLIDRKRLDAMLAAR